MDNVDRELAKFNNDEGGVLKEVLYKGNESLPTLEASKMANPA